MSSIDSEVPHDTPNANERASVVLADDIPQVRHLVAHLLGDRFDIAEAGSADEAIERLRARTPSLLICDVRMPGGGAETVLRVVRHDPKLANLPVLLISGNALPKDRVLGFKWGADDFLTKPFEPSEFAARIEALLDPERQRHTRLDAWVGRASEEPKVEAEDLRFLMFLRTIVEANLSDTAFRAQDFAREAGFTSSTLSRRLKSLGIQSPVVFIHRVRLERARELLEARSGSVVQVSRQCGFGSTARFRRYFQEEFGHSPSEGF